MLTASTNLLTLAERDVAVVGDESPEVVVMRERYLLVQVSGSSTPLDLPTHRVRLARWEGGEGVRLTGMREFMHTLETLPAPAPVAAITGEATTYTFLLDEFIFTILACATIDKPTAI